MRATEQSAPAQCQERDKFSLEPILTPPQAMEECMWERRSSGWPGTPQSSPSRHSSIVSGSGPKSTDAESSNSDWDDSSGQSELESSDSEIADLMEMMEDLELAPLSEGSSEGHVSSDSFIDQAELRHLHHRYRQLRKKEQQLAQRNVVEQCAFGPALEGPSTSKARGPVASSQVRARSSLRREKGKDASASSKRSAPTTLETSSTPPPSTNADVGTATPEGPSSREPRHSKPRRSAAKRVKFS